MAKKEIKGVNVRILMKKLTVIADELEDIIDMASPSELLAADVHAEIRSIKSIATEMWDSYLLALAGFDWDKSGEVK